MIGIIDYGAGNIRSVANAVAYCTDQPLKVVERPGEMARCSRFILPGVGAFAPAMERLREREFDAAIQEQASQGKYLLGICLGMQLLAGVSHEFGVCEGLDLIPGEIRPLAPQGGVLRVPHMGWNHIEIRQDHPLLQGIGDQRDFYFAHSYFFGAGDPSHVLAETGYGGSFASVVAKDNLMGVQFHPEKSQAAGLALIKNFIGLERRG
ncbi:MAG: imidazole glycerol phosphate synthase subunit HisH [Desulfobacter sp.]|nr:MAG: imidazole glycerol phosphate synthase subunit HisH [Desulfobacter sp.]